MRFTQIAAGDELTRKMAQEVVKKSPLLANHIEFFKKPGSAVTVRTGGNTSGIDGQTRATIRLERVEVYRNPETEEPAKSEK